MNCIALEQVPVEDKSMEDITTLLSAAADGDTEAAHKLMPRIYDELKRIASSKMSHEQVGHSLDATALVHEAYIRLIGNDGSYKWDNRAHFFASAAEAMRRILVENARRKSRMKRGGQHKRVDLAGCNIYVSAPHADVLATHEALDRLELEDELGAKIVKLRFFAGFSVEEAANTLGLSRAAGFRHWKFSRAWLQRELSLTTDD